MGEDAQFSPLPDMEQIKGLLNAYWPNIQSLHMYQEEVISSVLEGKDTLALIPTGGGKSMLYQLPAFRLSGMTVVISPLIALMRDQTEQMPTRLQPHVAYLSSGMGWEEQSEIKKAISRDQIKLLYVSPERLRMPGFIELIREKCSLLVVDEAHCVSAWGHDFRPDYRIIGELREKLSKEHHVPILAVTATASRKVVKDILEQLQIEDGNVLSYGVQRKNLRFVVEAQPSDAGKIERTKAMLKIAKGRGGVGIVYCATKVKCEEVALILEEAGYRSAFFHADVDPRVKDETLQQFMDDELDVVVATIAFGMGINKPNVRTVIHYDPPRGLEAYAQEAGRAGRDGAEAVCISLVGPEDVKRLDSFVSRNEVQPHRITQIYNLVKSVTINGMGVIDIKDLANHVAMSQTDTRTCLSHLERAGAIKLGYTQPITYGLYVREYLDEAAASYWSKCQEMKDEEGKLIPAAKFFRRLNTVGRIEISSIKLAQGMGKSLDQIAEMIQKLVSYGILGYEGIGWGMSVELKAELSEKRIKEICSYLNAESLKRHQSLRMYLSTDRCRAATISSYFGEEVEPCGKCDNCKRNSKAAAAPPVTTGNAGVVLEWRERKAEKLLVQPWQILPVPMAERIQQSKPRTIEELLEVCAPGIVSRYGEELVSLFKKEEENA